VAVATYPGTVSPLRGLDPFGEAERDVLFGRDRAREELAKLVSGDGFRAGLLYGEPGVGKTSLLKAGILPHLRDHGVVALYCEDPVHPAAAFATALSALGVQPQPGEQPTQFLARAVSATVAGQQFVFTIDDVDAVLHDDHTIGELADIFSRVVGRSAGRARFLFSCASERVHALGALERRTGSLFPPTSRYELGRMPLPEAASVLDRVLALSGIAADPKLAEAVVVGIGRDGPILPADIQLAAMAMRELRVDSLQGLQKLGGARELERAWLHHVCAVTGDERGALRLLAEIADGADTVDQAAHRLGFDPTAAHRTIGVLEQSGAVLRGNEGRVALRHELLVPRVRELTAPARAAARRAHDLLGSKTATRARLSLRELYSLRREGIAPVTAEEQAVVGRSRRFFKLVAAGIAAVPIIFLVLMWFSNRGHMYFDLDPRPGGDRVVVRAGRAGLSSFHWLPSSPGFGEIVADTGLSKAMIAPEAWKKIANQDLGGDLAGWDAQLKKVMAPQLAGLIDYATGNEKALDPLGKAAKNPDALAELLTALRPIARGTAAEIALVDSALAAGDSSPAVQRAAVALAGAAAQRNPAVYRDTLINTLMSADPEQRRIAFAAVRAIGGERARDLFSTALGKNPDASARRELLIELSASTSDEAPSASDAASVLADEGATEALKERAKSRLRRALADDPAATASALVPLIAEERFPADARIFAMGLLRDLDPLPPDTTALGEAAHTAFGSHSEAVRAAALPLYARLDPARASADLVALLDDKKAGKLMRKATAFGWGELARSADNKAANEALTRLIKDNDPEVRAAAAVAYGKLGRAAQPELQKMVKNERFEVAIGAAEGLAVSAEVGASISEAISGIAQLWKEKGRSRREAAKVFARLAKKKAGQVMNYLVVASRSPEDEALHPIGVEGLCNAANAGSAEARRNLAKITNDPSTDVRRRIIRCVAEGPDPGKNGTAIARELVKDADSGIRAEAARILAMSAGGGKVSTGVGEALLPLIDDGDRDVRLIAVRAIASLGPDAPKAAPTAMAKVFERGDEGEKLALLRAAKLIAATEVVAMAVSDPSPLVRVEAIDAALATGGAGAAALNSALADVDPQVRRAALEKLATSSDALEPAALEKALALAVRDTDPDISQLALTTLARVAPKDSVASRLGHALASRVERERAQAAAATIGLVERDAALAAQLLEPLLEDASHDVRVAMLPSLAAAWAKVNAPEKLAAVLRGSEKNGMRRLVAIAAFITLARTDAGKAAAAAALAKVAASGETMVRSHAKLAIGLIEAQADGLAFLQELVP
jgi:HEAT repeat protein